MMVLQKNYKDLESRIYIKNLIYLNKKKQLIFVKVQNMNRFDFLFENDMKPKT